MNNTHQAGFFRPVRDFVPAAHAVSLEIFFKLVSQLERNSKCQDMLLPFIKKVNVVVVKGSSGEEYAPYPTDYSYFSSAKILKQSEKECVDAACQAFKDSKFLTAQELEDFFPVVTTYSEVAITEVPDSKFASASKHRTKGPTMDSPIGTRETNGFKILPKGIGVVLMSYYRVPVEPVFDYTIQQQGIDEYLTYNQAGSTQLEWNESMIPVFLYKLMMRYGLFVSDELKIQVSQISKELL